MCGGVRTGVVVGVCVFQCVLHRMCVYMRCRYMRCVEEMCAGVRTGVVVYMRVWVV